MRDGFVCQLLISTTVVTYNHIVTPEEELAGLISTFTRGFGLHRPEETPCGVPVPVSAALALLELANDQPLSQIDLSNRLRLDKSTVSRLLKDMEQRGWVTRTRHDGDIRYYQLLLTSAGAHLAKEVVEARTAKFSRVLAHLPPSKRELAFRGLEVLIEAINHGQQEVRLTIAKRES